MKHKRRDIWQKVNRELAIWRIGALPGLGVIALVVLARLTGNLQFAEKVALDYFLRLRPAEPIDERILIVGIDEADIRNAGTYPLPDRDLASLLQRLRQFEPTVIGLDIFRDLPVEPGHAGLVEVFQSTKNLIAIEKVLPDRSGFTIDPPPALPSEQVGFADAVPDVDGYLRRSLLGTSDTSGQYKFSLTLRLAETYLASQGITLENGIRDPQAMRFGTVELPRFLHNSGGYVGADAGGTQVLINFRSGQKPFRMVSLKDVLAGTVPESWIRDRVVLVGVTALSAKDVVNSAAVSGSNPGLVYGVEVQAHAVSQILSAVLDGRSLLRVWPEGWEYLWIVAWGVLGISLARVVLSPFKTLLGLGFISLALVGICYGLLILGWWVPVVPALLVLVLNGAGLTASLFYRHEQTLRAKIQDRQSIIEQTFDTIHNGPLQTLARMLRDTQEQEITTAQLHSDLEQLNQELRSVYESIRREALTQGSHFYLATHVELDLQSPMHEILYEVYSYTLARDLPCFKTLKFKITQFEQINDQLLTLDQKRGLCRFLEEALCNAGKHAVGVTRLDVICKQEQEQNLIQVVDNGAGVNFSITTSTGDPSQRREGRGTQQAKDLARQLGGRFRRFPKAEISGTSNSPNGAHGTVCELSWSVTKPWFWRF